MSEFLKSGNFFIGVNYWSSNAGCNMWHDFDEKIIESDVKQLSQNGVKVIRAFPTWSDFQPLNFLLGIRGYDKELAVGEEFLDGTDLEQKNGIDISAVKKFEKFCAIVEKYNLKLIVALITGWMSGRTYAPQAFINRNYLTDALCIKWEKKFCSYFVNHFKKYSCIIAWELGNECNCLGSIENSEQAYLWASSIAETIRLADNSRMVLSGMHSLQNEKNFTIHDQAEICDMLTIHPYSLFTPHCDYDGLLSERAIEHISCEKTLYADLGKTDCLVEEIGTLGHSFGGEQDSYEFCRASLFNSWAYDGIGFLWWCAYDYTNNDKPPYGWSDLERELGLFKADKTPKKTVSAFNEFNNIISTVGNLPARRREAVCVLNNQASWESAFGSFLLAKRAGLELQYCDTEIPEDAKLYIIPGEATLNMLNKRRVAKLLELAKKGATLLITHNGSLFSPFEEITGCISHGKNYVNCSEIEWGGKNIKIGKKIELDLEPITAKPICYNKRGKLTFLNNPYGKGQILFLNAPIEYYAVSTPNLLKEDNGLEKFYEYAKDIARIDKPIERANPHLHYTVHDIDENSAIVVMINNTQKDIEDSVYLNGYKFDKTFYGKVVNKGEYLQANVDKENAVVFAIKK